MNKPIIVLYLHDRAYDGLVALGGTVYEAMSGNAYFPSPKPSLPALRIAIDEVVEAIAKWGPVGNRGSHNDLVKLRLKSRKLWLMLRSEAEHVSNRAFQLAEIDYARMEVIMISSGFPLRKKNKPQGRPEQVQNFRQAFSRQLNRNQAKITWNKPLNLNSRNNIKIYTLYRATVPDFSKAVKLEPVTDPVYIETNNKKTEQTYHFWVAANNSAGEGVLSHMLTVRLLPV